MVLGQPGNQSGASVRGKGLLVIHFTRLEFRNVIWEFVCLRLVYVAMIKESDQKELGEGRVYMAYRQCSPSPVKAKAGTWKQELEQKPWRRAAYWLTYHGLLSLPLCVCVCLMDTFILFFL